MWSCLHFSPTCFEILSWNFALMYYRSSSSVVSLYCQLALRPSNHFLHLPPICIDNWAGNFKFDLGFFNVFLIEKSYIKNSPLKCSWRLYYAPFAVLRYISQSCIHFLSKVFWSTSKQLTQDVSWIRFG